MMKRFVLAAVTSRISASEAEDYAASKHFYERMHEVSAEHRLTDDPEPQTYRALRGSETAEAQNVKESGKWLLRRSLRGGSPSAEIADSASSKKPDVGLRQLLRTASSTTFPALDTKALTEEPVGGPRNLLRASSKTLSESESDALKEELAVAPQNLREALTNKTGQSGEVQMSHRRETGLRRALRGGNATVTADERTNSVQIEETVPEHRSLRGRSYADRADQSGEVQMSHKKETGLPRSLRGAHATETADASTNSVQMKETVPEHRNLRGRSSAEAKLPTIEKPVPRNLFASGVANTVPAPNSDDRVASLLNHKTPDADVVAVTGNSRLERKLGLNRASNQSKAYPEKAAAAADQVFRAQQNPKKAHLKRALRGPKNDEADENVLEQAANEGAVEQEFIMI